MRSPFKANQQLTQIKDVLERSQRGLGKRIDENRELLELPHSDEREALDCRLAPLTGQVP